MFPADCKYTKNHEFVKPLGDGTAIVGITNYAQEALGDVVFVDLPEVGRRYTKGEVAGVVESVKAASDVYAPLAGTVIAVNEALADAPEAINAEPYAAWFYRLQPVDAAALDKLLDAAAYQASCDA